MTLYVMHARKAGFSLVELSIVLVILGLLTGGILGGKSLIHAAELRAVTSEFSQWQTAVNTFQGKYHALPGDMDIAARFWGADSGCGTDGAGSNTTPGNLGGDAMDGTCNGNGNGLVSDNLWNSSAAFEQFLFWQHLSLAGLIPGQYTGVRGAPTVFSHIAGENAPAAKLSPAGWQAVSRSGATANVWWEANYGNQFIIGAIRGNDGFFNGVMSPEDAWNIDSKVDDGKPGTGSVHGFPHTNDCTNAASPSDYAAIYELTLSGALCGLHFLRAF